MDPVVHFELPYEDRPRIAAFYERAFGWQLRMLGDEMNNYVIAQTAESDRHGRPVHPGAINGGFYPRKADCPAQSPSVVIAVADVRACMEKIAAAGGVVLGEPMQIPGIGQYISFVDTEQNRVALLQPYVIDGKG